MLSASKLWKSSSISGPAATSKPARRNSISIRSRALVTGCNPPCSSPRPGSVTSIRPAASLRSVSARSRSARRASMTPCTRSLASLMRWPAAGLSPAGRPPSDFNCSVSTPFLPSQRTRTSSRAARSPHAATSSRACPTREVRSCKTLPPLLDCRAEGGLRPLRDRAERFRFVHGEIREHLAVDLHSGLVEAVDDAAVGQAIQTRGCVDTRDPERAKLTLLLPPVAIGVLARLDHGLLRRAVYLATGVVVALRLAENFLVTAACRHATLDSRHGAAPLLTCDKEEAARGGRHRCRARDSSRRSAPGV